MDEKSLLRLKQRISDAETQAAQLDGQKQYLMESLKEQFDVSTIPAAKKKLEQLEEKIEFSKDALDLAMEEIEERYDDGS